MGSQFKEAAVEGGINVQGERGVTPTSRMFAVIVIILLVALLISGCGQHKEPAPATAAEISAVAPNQPLTSTTPAPELDRKSVG